MTRGRRNTSFDRRGTRDLPCGNVQNLRVMACRAEERVEAGMGEDDRCGVDERVALNAFRVPYGCIDDDLDRARRIGQKPQHRDGPGFDPQMSLQRFRRCEVQVFRMELLAQRFQVHALPMPDHDEYQPAAFLLKKQVLGSFSGQRRHQHVRFFTGEHGRMFARFVRNALPLQKFVDVRQ